MADFNTSIEKTLINEGGYVNNPKDPGGETYLGWSRVNHPTDPVWLLIDKAKAIPNFPNNLDSDPSIREAIKNSYKAEYWNTILGDSINSQPIADSIFDYAVNAGVSASVALVQTALDLSRDGKMGDSTITSLNNAVPETFLMAFSLAKIVQYVGIVKRKPASQQFFYGWVKRTLNL
jgi:lysozyme family protein